MSSATLTSPPIATARLVVDTDVASFIFKWHPEFAPRYVDIVGGSELIVSFMTVAEMCQGALDANWGPRKMRRAGSLSRRLLSPSFGQPVVLHVGHRSEREHTKGDVPLVRIAATALVVSVPLVTNNPKDYRHLDKLQICFPGSRVTASSRKTSWRFFGLLLCSRLSFTYLHFPDGSAGAHLPVRISRCDVGFWQERFQECRIVPAIVPKIVSGSGKRSWATVQNQ